MIAVISAGGERDRRRQTETETDKDRDTEIDGERTNERTNFFINEGKGINTIRRER